MLGAGVRQFGGPVEVLELPGPRGLRPDEVLIDVQACGVGNWDEFTRTGEWDLGIRPPMALGVEATGLVAAAGDRVTGIAPGDRVTVHSAPLRDQGAWAGRHIAAAGQVAVLPAGVPVDAAAALPVPARDWPERVRALTGRWRWRSGQRGAHRLRRSGAGDAGRGRLATITADLAALTQARHGARGSATVLRISDSQHAASRR